MRVWTSPPEDAGGVSSGSSALAPFSALGTRPATAFALDAPARLETDAFFALGGFADFRGLRAAGRLMALAFADFFSGGRPRLFFFECVAKTLCL